MFNSQWSKKINMFNKKVELKFYKKNKIKINNLIKKNVKLNYIKYCLSRERYLYFV